MKANFNRMKLVDFDRATAKNPLTTSHWFEGKHGTLAINFCQKTKMIFS